MSTHEEESAAYKELHQYLPIVDRIIRESQIPGARSEKYDIGRLKALVSSVRANKNRMSLESLQKCNKVLARLVHKTNKSTGTEEIAPKEIPAVKTETGNLESARARLNLFYNKSKEQEQCKPKEEKTFKHLFPSVMTSASSQNPALNAYMNSHVELNQKFLLQHNKSQSSSGPVSDVSTSSLSHSKRSSDKSPSKKSEKNRSPSESPSKKSEFKKSKKSSHKHRSRDDRDKISETRKDTEIYEKSDILDLEKLRTALVEKLKEEEHNGTSKSVNLDAKACDSVVVDEDKQEKVDSVKSKSEETLSKALDFKSLTKPKNETKTLVDDDSIFEEEIKSALSKEIGLEITNSPSFTIKKDTSKADSSTKNEEGSKSRRISLDTYKEKQLFTPHSEVSQVRQLTNNKQPSCPASPDPENCQQSLELPITNIPLGEDIVQPLPNVLLWPVSNPTFSIGHIPPMQIQQITPWGSTFRPQHIANITEHSVFPVINPLCPLTPTYNMVDMPTTPNYNLPQPVPSPFPEFGSINNQMFGDIDMRNVLPYTMNSVNTFGSNLSPSANAMVNTSYGSFNRSKSMQPTFIKNQQRLESNLINCANVSRGLHNESNRSIPEQHFKPLTREPTFTFSHDEPGALTPGDNPQFQRNSVHRELSTPHRLPMHSDTFPRREKSIPRASSIHRGTTSEYERPIMCQVTVKGRSSMSRDMPNYRSKSASREIFNERERPVDPRIPFREKSQPRDLQRERQDFSHRDQFNRAKSQPREFQRENEQFMHQTHFSNQSSQFRGRSQSRDLQMQNNEFQHREMSANRNTPCREKSQSRDTSARFERFSHREPSMNRNVPSREKSQPREFRSENSRPETSMSRNQSSKEISAPTNSYDGPRESRREKFMSRDPRIKNKEIVRDDQKSILSERSASRAESITRDRPKSVIKETTDRSSSSRDHVGNKSRSPTRKYDDKTKKKFDVNKFKQKNVDKYSNKNSLSERSRSGKDKYHWSSNDKPKVKTDAKTGIFQYKIPRIKRPSTDGESCDNTEPSTDIPKSEQNTVISKEIEKTTSHNDQKKRNANKDKIKEIKKSSNTITSVKKANHVTKESLPNNDILTSESIDEAMAISSTVDDDTMEADATVETNDEQDFDANVNSVIKESDSLVEAQTVKIVSEPYSTIKDPDVVKEKEKIKETDLTAKEPGHVVEEPDFAEKLPDRTTNESNHTVKDSDQSLNTHDSTAKKSDETMESDDISKTPDSTDNPIPEIENSDTVVKESDHTMNEPDSTNKINEDSLGENSTENKSTSLQTNSTIESLSEEETLRTLLEKLKGVSKYQAVIAAFQKIDANKGKSNKKFDKGSRELRMLQEDIRTMFICNGVLEATGKRSVRSVDSAAKSSNAKQKSITVEQKSTDIEEKSTEIEPKPTKPKKQTTKNKKPTKKISTSTKKESPKTQGRILRNTVKKSDYKEPSEHSESESSSGDDTDEMSLLEPTRSVVSKHETTFKTNRKRRRRYFTKRKGLSRSKTKAISSEEDSNSIPEAPPKKKTNELIKSISNKKSSVLIEKLPSNILNIETTNNSESVVEDTSVVNNSINEEPATKLDQSNSETKNDSHDWNLHTDQTKSDNKKDNDDGIFSWPISTDSTQFENCKVKIKEETMELIDYDQTDMEQLSAAFTDVKDDKDFINTEPLFAHQTDMEQLSAAFTEVKNEKDFINPEPLFAHQTDMQQISAAFTDDKKFLTTESLLDATNLPLDIKPNFCITNVFSLSESIPLQSDSTVMNPESFVENQCPECLTEFENEEMLSNHVLVTHVDTGRFEHFFKCASNHCFSEYHKSDDFASHLSKQHANEDRWKCVYCDVSVEKYSKLLIVHMQRQHASEAFKCKTCHFRCCSVTKMLAHIKADHSRSSYTFFNIPYQAKPRDICDTTDDLFVCGGCNFSSNSDLDFKKHIHETDVDSDCFRCAFCPKARFKLEKAVFAHYQKLHLWRNRSCNYCNFRAISVDNIKKHAREKHDVSNDVCWRLIELDVTNSDYFNCPYCYFSCQQPKKLLEHQKEHGQEDGSEIICRACKKKCSSWTTLVEHSYAVHVPWAELSNFSNTDKNRTSIRPYLCGKNCPKFVTKERYLDHLLTCKEEHKCQFQDCFYEPDGINFNLIKHLGKQHNFKVYTCCFCPFAHDDKQTALVHIRTCHSLETPYVFMRFNEAQSITGIILLVNISENYLERNLFHFVTTDFDKLWSSLHFLENMGISEAIIDFDKPEEVIQPEAIPLDTNEISKDTAPIVDLLDSNSESDNDNLFIADNLGDKNPLSIDKEDIDLDFKTTILRRDSTGSNPGTILNSILHKPAKPISSKTGLSGNDLFICAACSYHSDSSKKFQGHAYNCEPVKTKLFPCYHCMEQCQRVSNLLDHLMDLHGTAKYICNICKGTETSSKKIMIHFKKNHSISSSDVQILPIDPTKTDPDADKFTVKVRTAKLLEPTPPPAPVQLAFGPSEINIIPNRPIFPDFVKCKICAYENKVRTNLIRHLQMHLKEKDGIVPTTAPINPVPHLETNELYFDKMTNLALSSNIDRLPSANKDETKRPQIQSPQKVVPKTLTDVSLVDADGVYPCFVPENKRFVCGASSCVYKSISEDMLRRHWISLHSGEILFHCQHCGLVFGTPNCMSMVTRISEHFLLHKENLFKCFDCGFMSDDSQAVKSHSWNDHSHCNIITIRKSKDPVDKPFEAPPSIWKCGFCKLTTSDKKEMRDHAKSVHKFNNQYKCDHCNSFTPTYNTMIKHMGNVHPDLPHNWTCAYKLQELVNEKKRPIEAVVKELAPVVRPKRRRTNSTIVINPEWNLCPPRDGMYFCSICNNFTSADEISMRNHLREEMQYNRFQCVRCDYISVSENKVIEHSIKEHAECEIIELPKSDEAEGWISNYISFQKKEMSNPENEEPPLPVIDEAVTKEKKTIYSKKPPSPVENNSKNDAYEFVELEPKTEKEGQCPYCNCFFGKNMKIHMMRHKGIKPHKCFYCDYDAVTLIEVRLHIRRSHKDLPIKIVKKENIDENDISLEGPSKPLKYVRQNMKTHTCTVCKAEVVSREIDKHKELCHPKAEVQLVVHKNSKVYLCSICSNYSVNEALLNEHFQSSHPGAEVNFTITTIGSKKDKKSPKKHFRRFSCKYCSVNFKLYSEVVEHFSINHPEIPIHILPYTTSSVKSTEEVTLIGKLNCIITGCHHIGENPLDLLYHVRQHYESYYCTSCCILFTSYVKYHQHSCKFKKMKSDGNTPMLKQRLTQIYELLALEYNELPNQISFDQYLDCSEPPSNPDQSSMNENTKDSDNAEPPIKKAKRVAKKSTAQVHPMHQSIIEKKTDSPRAETSDDSSSELRLQIKEEGEDSDDFDFE